MSFAAEERHGRHLRDRGSQVPLDAYGEGLERRDVERAAEHAAAGRRWRHSFEQQAVDAPEKGGERLATACRRQNERGVSPCDRRPTERLGTSRFGEGREELVTYGGVETFELAERRRR